MVQAGSEGSGLKPACCEGSLWRRQVLDDGLHEGGGGERGVRLPALAARPVRVVGDASDEREAVLPVADDRLEHLIEVGVVGDGALARREVESQRVVLRERRPRCHRARQQQWHADGRQARVVRRARVTHLDDVVAADIHVQLVGVGRGPRERHLLAGERRRALVDVPLPEGRAVAARRPQLHPHLADDVRHRRPAAQLVLQAGGAGVSARRRVGGGGDAVAVDVQPAGRVGRGEGDVAETWVFVEVRVVRHAPRHAHQQHVLHVAERT